MLQFRIICSDPLKESPTDSKQATRHCGGPGDVGRDMNLGEEVGSGRGGDEGVRHEAEMEEYRGMTLRDAMKEDGDGET